MIALTPVEINLLKLLNEIGSIRGTAQVGYALWPERSMQPQGAALAAGKVLRHLRDCGFVSSTVDDVLSRYDITQNGRLILSRMTDTEKDPRQLSLIE